MSLMWNDDAKKVMENMQDKIYKRKTEYNVYKKRFQPIKHKKTHIVPSKLPFFPSIESNWIGDVMNKNPSRGHLRF